MNGSTVTTDATTVAREVLDRLENAWNDADGAAFGTIRGEHIVGASAIGAGHDGIFRGIYVGSVIRMRLVRAEELSPDVLLVVSLNTLDCPTGPLAGRHQAFSTNVVTRAGDDGWRVVATSNTLVVA